MTKREAMQQAHRIAYNVLQGALDAGVPYNDRVGSLACDDECGACRACKDCDKVFVALDTLTQRHVDAGREHRFREGT